MIGWGLNSFRVPGLSHRVSGSGTQVRVLVPGLITEPVPVPAAETCDPEMFLTFAQSVGRFALLHLGQHVVLSLPKAKPQHPSGPPSIYEVTRGARGASLPLLPQGT